VAFTRAGFCRFRNDLPKKIAMNEIPQAAVVARQMYADGKTVRAILAATGFSLDQLYRALDGLPQPNDDSLLPPIARRRIIARKTSRAATRVALVARLMRAAELQIYGLEQQLEKAGYVPAESERNSRVTAALARTMRELAAKDERDTSRKAPNKSGESNDEPVPLDIDELRRSLIRKMDAILAEREGTLPGVGDG
jgi:hypothetical protein